MHRWCLLNLTVQGFSLNLTVRGVSNKHCLLTFFICAAFVSFVFLQSRQVVAVLGLLPLWESVIVMFCCTLLYVHSIIAIILLGKKKLVALLNLSSSCLVMVEWLFLAVPWGCLRFVIVVFPDHTHLLFVSF